MTNPFFTLRGGLLHAEDVPVARIAAAYGTPFYCYSKAALTAAYQDFAAAFRDMPALICFAVKANGNLNVIGCLGALGAGADVVSGGELQRALAAGVDAGKIIFSGVGKTQDEILAAARAGIYQFNAESLPELDALAAAAETLSMTLPVALRVNPDVDAQTHAKIATGEADSKFGINLAHLGAALEAVRQRPRLDLCGIAVHIGSQLTSLAPFDAAFGVTARLIKDLQGRGFGISRVDAGGGLGIRYRDETVPAAADYAAVVRRHFGGSGLHIGLEPGRRLVAAAGILVSRVIYAKTGDAKNFLIIDAAMNDLMRPALYDAWHGIFAAQPGGAAKVWDVVGPVCETGDQLGLERRLPMLQAGDLVAIENAGAYGASMASTYNARRLVPEFMVDGGAFALIRRAVGIDEQMRWDVAPVWSR